MPICTNCSSIHHEETPHKCLLPIEPGYEYRPVYTKTWVGLDGTSEREEIKDNRITREEFDIVMAEKIAIKKAAEIKMIDGPEDLINP